jgi:hypothetical protein
METMGSLTIRVYTGQAQIPVEGATVVVTQPGENGKYDLLSVQITDDSGKIAAVSISTPAAWESTQPNSGQTQPPFALCSVWAEHPGYATLKVEGVQIFPGVETVQNLELIPLGAGQSSLQEEDVRQIPAQSL